MNKKQYTFYDDTGDAVITAWEVLPGVRLTYNSIHMDELRLTTDTEGDLLEIHHCREGRIEQEFKDDFFYLMPGDLSVARRTQMLKAYRFPLRHYHGITLIINMNAVPEAFLQLLQELDINLPEMIRRLCSDRSCFMIRAEQNIEHILSELYTAHGRILQGYIKLKLLELLLVLSHIDTNSDHSPDNTLPKAHVQLAHRAAAYLAKHMEEHVTVPELARVLGVSDTQLKVIFKAVYGMPVFSYMRTQKMQAAAQLLIHTEKSVAEIAEAFGYANTSKFAAAFQSIMGETPRAFRQEHTKLRST